MSIKRIKVGSIGGIFGIYMSKPGMDVETCGEAGMVFSPEKHFFQVIHERHIDVQQTTRSGMDKIFRRIDHPDFGFTPLVTVDSTASLFEYTGVNSSRNTAIKPFARHIFSQSRTGFYCSWTTLNTYVNGAWVYFSQGGSVVIRLYNVQSMTGSYALPSSYIVVPDQ